MQKTFKLLSLAILGVSISLLAWPTARNLEYEFAVVLSWILVIILPLLGLFFVTNFAVINKDMSAFAAVLAMPLLALIPGWIMFRFGLCDCVEMGFLFWAAILVLPAGWLGLAGFLWVQRLRPVSRLYLVAAFAPFVVSFFYLALLWFMPQKRVTSITLGFIHGPIYDRWIPVDSAVLSARFAHSLLGIALIAVAMGIIRFRSRWFILSMMGIAILEVVSFRGLTGTHGFWALENHLSHSIKRDGIQLNYNRKSQNDEDMAEIIARDAVFDIYEIKKALGLGDIPVIKIFAYENSSQKKLLFGGGDTDITDVWTPSVHIELRRSPHPTLRHELVHAVASFASWHGLGFHPNMILTEGLAMAIAPMDQELEMDKVAASLLRSGRLKSIESLISPTGFWSESGARSYIAAGSLIQWIQKKFGRSAVGKIYSGQNAELVTGTSMQLLLTQWREEVLKGYDSRTDLQVERLSRDPGVLEDFCPHSFEDLARSRSEGWLVRLRQPLGWDPDDLYDWWLQRAPQDRNIQLRHFVKKVKRMLADSHFSKSELKLMVETAQRARNWPPKVIEDVEMMLIQVDLEALTGELGAAQQHLLELKNEFLSKDPGPAWRRQVEVRQAVDSILVANEAQEWHRYLAGWSSIPLNNSQAEWISVYLRAKRMSFPARQEIELWSDHINKMNDFPEIKKEWIKITADALAAMGAYKDAGDMYQRLAIASKGESKRLAEQNQRKMSFFASSRQVFDATKLQ